MITQHLGRDEKAIARFNTSLRELMRQRGLSQATMAERMSVKLPTFNRWVCGADPKLSTLVRLAKALDVNLDELAGREVGG